MSDPNSPQIPIIIKKPFGGVSSPGLSSAGLSSRLPGIFPSTRYGQQVISSGIPSLDSYLGNGFQIGSVVIIKDVFPCQYADMILKCFIAEGASYNHHLYVRSGGFVSSSAFANQLPSLVSRREISRSSKSDNYNNETDNLKIAWRYKDNSPLPATLSTRAGLGNVKGQQKLSSKFEFTNKSTVAELGGQHLSCSPINACHEKLGSKSSVSFEPLSSELVIKEIALVAKEFSLTAGRKPTNVLRIAFSHCEDELTPSFMTSLRSISRHTNSVIVITISDLKLNSSQTFKIEHFADYVIQVQGIVDDLKKKQFGDNIHGLCDIKKLDSINSIKPMEKPKDLGFSFRRKQIIFQELHLQPEDDTTAQREASNSKTKTMTHKLHEDSGSSCGGSTVKGKSIDF